MGPTKTIRSPVELCDIHECKDLMDFALYVYENTNCNACVRYCSTGGIVYPADLLGMEEAHQWVIKNIYGIQFIVDIGEDKLHVSDILEFPIYLNAFNDAIEICENFKRKNGN